MDIHVLNHPLVDHKLTVLRDKNTPSSTFRELVSELVMLEAYEATRDIEVVDKPMFGAFTIDVVNDTSFIYNQYIDMDEDAYNRYVDQVISRSDVDSGIRPAYGEQLLTLSTCEYSSANGRYVVVARRVSD